MKKNLILVTGGDGRFAKVLKEKNKKLNLFFANKKQCNILKLSSIEKIIKNKKFYKEQYNINHDGDYKHINFKFSSDDFFSLTETLDDEIKIL